MTDSVTDLRDALERIAERAELCESVLRMVLPSEVKFAASGLVASAIEYAEDALAQARAALDAHDAGGWLPAISNDHDHQAYHRLLGVLNAERNTPGQTRSAAYTILTETVIGAIEDALVRDSKSGRTAPPSPADEGVRDGE